MPQRDLYHDAFRRALEKDGWRITHDPLPLTFGRHNLFVNLGADRPLGAEKQGRKIAVEAKSFRGVSEMTDLERALGQFVLYRFLLSDQEPDRTLYLALPAEAFAGLLEGAEGLRLITSQSLKLVVIRVDREEVTRWIE